MKINYKVGGLFSGIGGFELGFQQAGYKICWAVESDKEAARTYSLNFPEHHLLNKDIKTIAKKEIKDLTSVDVLIAGFPCQPFSIAGYRKGFKDPRGNLFDDIIRFVEELKKKPKVLVLENVRNFFSHGKGKTWEYVQKALRDNEYSQIPMILNTSTTTGIPQNRERAYIIGFKNEPEISKQIMDIGKLNQEELLTGKKKKSDFFLESFNKNLKKDKKSYKEYLEKTDIDKKYYYSPNKFNTRSASDDKKYIYEELEHSMKDDTYVYQWRRTGEVRQNKKNDVPTLTASMGAGGHNVPLILEGKKIRKLTPRECFNFQGFPKSYKLPENMANTSLYKQAGNAVTVPLVKKIAIAIKKTLDESY